MSKNFIECKTKPPTREEITCILCTQVPVVIGVWEKDARSTVEGFLSDGIEAQHFFYGLCHYHMKMGVGILDRIRGLFKAEA